MNRTRGFSPGEVGDHDPCKSVDEPEDGDPDEGEPPEPEDEEVLLVEQVVGEDAQVVRPVDGSCCGADSDVASHLGGRRRVSISRNGVKQFLYSTQPTGG